jgi:hypothetical protein
MYLSNTNKEGRPMAVLRNAPGERAKVSDRYALVGHYGEATGIRPIWLNRGDQFPRIEVDIDAGPLWYVRLYEAAEVALAA